MTQNYLRNARAKYGSFEQSFKVFSSDFFAFWDKTAKTETLVISTHGIIKKVSKTPKNEIRKAEKIRLEYFKQKNSK